MAGQGLERREVLRVMALAAAASQFPGFHRWAFACDHFGVAPLQVKPAAYMPQFFTPAEYTTLERLTEMIIPSDGSPGAREAGVSEFVDFMVWSDPKAQLGFRSGLTWLEAHSDRLHAKPFRELSLDQQAEILERLAYEDHHRAGEEEGRKFFKLIRGYTLMGFYTTRIGLEQLNYPGLQTIYEKLPGCPHPGNPQHQALPPPQP